MPDVKTLLDNLAASSNAQSMIASPVPTTPGQAPAQLSKSGLAKSVDVAKEILKKNNVKGVNTKEIKKAVSNVASGGSTSYLENYMSPEQRAQTIAIRNKLNTMADNRMAEEQAGISDYERNISQYANERPFVDLTPIAGLIDKWAGDQNNTTSRIATTQVGESPSDKRKALMAMKDKLQGMKQGLSKSQYDVLKAQLDATTEDARAKMEMARFNRLLTKDDETNIQKLAKVTESKASMDANIAELNNALGFDLDAYDPNTNTVNGKPVDLAGASIPGIGRVAFYDKNARIIEDTMSRIFNTELKDRSGAAVTSEELTRLKNEFSSGRFQTEEEKLGATQRYARLLREQLNRQESAFTPTVRSKYQERISDPNQKMSGGVPSQKVELSPEEELKLLESEGY